MALVATRLGGRNRGVTPNNAGHAGTQPRVEGAPGPSAQQLHEDMEGTTMGLQWPTTGCVLPGIVDQAQQGGLQQLHHQQWPLHL